MEATTHLLQLVQKMRSQITQLERENRALRGELEVCGQRSELPGRGAAGGGGNGDVGSFGHAGEGAAACPVPAPEEQTDSTMTVRRYPTASPAPAPSSARPHQAGKRPPSNGLLDVPGSAQPPTPPAAAQLTHGEGKGLGRLPTSSQSYGHSSKMKLFQEHVRKCRGKVKAVSFLLPAGTPSHAEKQSSLQSPQTQSPKQLTTIAKKDV